MGQPVLVVEQLGKRYRIGRPRAAQRPWRDRLADPAQWLRRRRRADCDDTCLWALRAASFEVTPGEVVGVIGRNGSGKSTLLKILARVVTPTTGRAVLHGRVGSLLEVGTGFHPELTGRENIFLSGAILGLRRDEIVRRFDEIVAFSGVERFLDTPVKRYSSGMYVRLAFAVAAHLEPEILLVDEVLAVGDLPFQQKCLGRMGHVARCGRTILFVSHNLAAVTQICSRALVLDEGRIVFDGRAADAVRLYVGAQSAGQSSVRFALDPTRPAQLRALCVTGAEHQNPERSDRPLGAVGPLQDRIRLRLEYDVQSWPPGTYVCVAVTSATGVPVLWSADVRDPEELARCRPPGRYIAEIEVPPRVLAPGAYHVSAAIYGPGAAQALDYVEQAVRFEVRDDGGLLSRFGVAHPAVTAIPLAWHTRPAADPAPGIGRNCGDTETVEAADVAELV